MNTDRRTFIQQVGCATAACLWLPQYAAQGCIAGPPNEVNSTHRILTLRLRTAAALSEMRAFYEGTLELDVAAQTDTSLTIRVGQTALTFDHVEITSEEPRPFYHFAFNIPHNKIAAAHDWQRDRTPLFETPAHMIDARYPERVRHFRNWNAHSVFFADPAGNVLEHIARHDLDNMRDGAFTARDMLYASEIGLVTHDVDAFGNAVQVAFQLDQYRSGSDQFRAFGDEHGLLLIFKDGRPLGVGSGTDFKASAFPAQVGIKSPGPEKSWASGDSAYTIDSHE